MRHRTEHDNTRQLTDKTYSLPIFSKRTFSWRWHEKSYLPQRVQAGMYRRTGWRNARISPQNSHECLSHWLGWQIAGHQVQKTSAPDPDFSPIAQCPEPWRLSSRNGEEREGENPLKVAFSGKSCLKAWRTGHLFDITTIFCKNRTWSREGGQYTRWKHSYQSDASRSRYG